MKQMRDERGQGSVEYVGIVAAAVAIVLVIVMAAPGLGSTLRGGIENAVCKVVGTGCGGGSASGGPAATGGAGGTPGGGGPGAPGAPGTPGSGTPGTPGATSPTGGGENGDAGTDIPCTTAVSAAQCIPGIGYNLGRRPEKLLQKVHQATDALNNSGARPGTPEFDRLKAARDNLQREYLAAKRYANNPVARGLAGAKKLTNPSIDDIIRRGETPADRAARAMKPPPSGALPRAGGAASKILKGAGIAGTAITGYQNVKKDGALKGTFKTGAGIAAAAGAVAVTEVACAPIAVTGIGAAACAGAGVAAAGVGNAVGQWAGGGVYDHVLTPAYNHVLKPVGRGAYEKVLKPLGEGAGNVVETLNPTNWCC